jgi:hypothetical protein
VLCKERLGKVDDGERMRHLGRDDPGGLDADIGMSAPAVVTRRTDGSR